MTSVDVEMVKCACTDCVCVVSLANAVKRDDPHTAVLLTTGFADAAIDEGARSYELIRKPYRRAELNEKIRAVLDKPGART